MRLDKYLADMGIGTRSEVKQYIRRKQVLVGLSFRAERLHICDMSILCSINQAAVSARLQISVIKR